MYAFGILGSYFSQGVYAVAGPSQGALDIIIVQQEDGSFKSSPWFVKCGDFQGALSAGEKIVDISVNGLPAYFRMLLNSRGEAYFEEETQGTVNQTLPVSESKKQIEKVQDLDSPGHLTEKEGSQVERIKKRSPKKNLDEKGQNQLDQPRNLKHQESDLLENQPLRLEVENEGENATSFGKEITGFVRRDESCLCSLETEAISETLKASDFDIGVIPVVINMGDNNALVVEVDDAVVRQKSVKETEQCGCPADIFPCLEISCKKNGYCCPFIPNEPISSIDRKSATDDIRLSDFDTMLGENSGRLQHPSNYESHDKDRSLGIFLDKCNARVSIDESTMEDYGVLPAQEVYTSSKTLITDSIHKSDIDTLNFEPTLPSVRSSETDNSSYMMSEGIAWNASIGTVVCVAERNNSPQEVDGETSKGGKLSRNEPELRMDFNSVAETREITYMNKVTVVPPSRWTMWPTSFWRTEVGKTTVSEVPANTKISASVTNTAVGSPLVESFPDKTDYSESTQKPKMQGFVPTSAQIASLNLKRGPNKVTFTFPRVLGRTQVEANIYLWNWNTRIVISDVDGTITKSDVLGQFMPLVGRDWSQSGVTGLFSAIKENGYEVLFLSARAISQAYLTRQFLVNLEQNGKRLPEGPILISPDGLIPSLYREVVKRTPHEFKISCLEVIRRLFPDHVNPFYAGFGNRDTDEISYLKVGIPLGKIFLINPKGEVMVNRHVHAKTYTSIHALVDNMFPPVSSSEWEDFNSWNFWKLPISEVDDELTESTNRNKVKTDTTNKR
ncbi:hypothetical protein KP509_25G000600 [Ceratopteris richardii]|uniref:LNS2/PITP domain-containing protein n=1 Tax=Ceratopteris richardii TaxID=49495 RepID=A0A8T2RN89_CERRI|nr:hypothetical protein KP509_25G000600 [Ceratopteris richardii]